MCFKCLFVFEELKMVNVCDGEVDCLKVGKNGGCVCERERERERERETNMLNRVRENVYL